VIFPADPPDGAPSCSIFPINNYTDLALVCSWVGGFPPPSLNWSPNVNGDKTQDPTNITRVQPGSETSNNSIFTCYGTHVTLNAPQSCSSRTWLPYGEPKCSAYVTRNNEYLMLSCSWEGGVPRALLWWASSSGDMQGTSEENANILVLRSSSNYSGKAFICHVRHPLAKDSKQCVLTLEAPVLMTQRSVVFVYEGNDVQLSCILSKNYPAVTEITWYNNVKQNVGETPKKYILQRAAAWYNLTVRETDSMVDSGQYWCSATNAVGGAEIPVLLVVKRYPMPPNVTISKITYSSQQRTDVLVEWLVQRSEGLTGFFIERQRLSVGKSDDVPIWQKVVGDLEPSTRSYQITNLDPSGKYAFRVTAINYRTTGHPSDVKSPANPPFKAYPAVIGAAIGGMLLAMLPTVLFFIFVLRNRSSHPRLHSMIFGNKRGNALCLLSGLEIVDPGQVIYRETRTNGVVDKGVILECGPTLPDVYIWSFTKPGADTIRAIVYNFGKGPKLQELAKDLGDLNVITNSASLSIAKLPLAAEGLYTCQALYDTAEGAKFYYYYVYLRVLVPVSKPYILLSDSSPIERASVWMRCGLENGTGPIHYVWEQETQSGQVSKLLESDSNLLNITSVSRNHTGWFRCLAKNEVNQETGDKIWLNVIFGPDVPQIDVTPYSVTDRGYSALERETVSLLCQASSNPPSQYVWFYNNSQVYTGPQLTITKILRMHTGYYACLAQNTYLNTRATKTITLTVYYPPDGVPSCSIFPTNNYNDLALICSWEGGYPLATLNWSPYVNGDSSQGVSNITRILSGPETANNSVFTCYGSHVALSLQQRCSTKTWLPNEEPQCSAYATRNNEYLMLSCSWEGGVPRAQLWWASSSGDMQGTSEENSNILVLRSSATYSGKAFVCHAKHPLVKESKTCMLKLEAPVLMAQRSIVSVYEGNDVQLTCILSRNYPAVTEITWYNNMKQRVGDSGTPTKYVLQQAAASSNLTVRETDGLVDGGQYWCAATNAVGGAEIPILLVVL
ncbi:V-set and immunoglobulin domain-containing protein 10-like 2, partial [Clarias magur]